MHCFCFMTSDGAFLQGSVLGEANNPRTVCRFIGFKTPFFDVGVEIVNGMRRKWLTI